MPKPNEIEIVRLYDAPVELVWEVWTDPAHAANWWGPRGFTITTESKDLRPGGKWIYTMHGPDGTDYPNISTYHEVVRHRKLVYDHGGNAERDKLFTVTVTFDDVDGQTLMRMTMALPTAEEAAATRRFIKEANGNSTWDRLGEYLERSTGGKDVFIVNRSFAADVETVFAMWTDPEHLARWLPPTGSTMSYIEASVAAGTSSHYKMTDAGGQVMYGKIAYREIAPPRRLVYSQHFCDPDGKLAKPPFAPTWPDAMLTTVTFAAEGPAQTRVTVQWEVDGDATDIERQTFIDAKPGMTIGWTGSFDKLDSLLVAPRSGG